MKKIIILLIAITIIACNNSEQEKDTKVKDTSTATVQSPNLSDSIYQIENGWGYDIKMDGKTYIHQPHVPSVGGSQGFSTQEKAKKAAAFIRFKIENNIMPPSVSPNELDSIGVLD